VNSHKTQRPDGRGEKRSPAPSLITAAQNKERLWTMKLSKDCKLFCQRIYEAGDASLAADDLELTDEERRIAIEVAARASRAGVSPKSILVELEKCLMELENARKGTLEMELNVSGAFRR
jgi:hypothetical protein